MNESGILTLVLGGARSGKSEVAEQLAARRTAPGASRPAVTYVATGGLVRGDDLNGEWSARVEAHRARRPPDWATVELETASELPRELLDAPGVVLLDSLGTWIVGIPAFGSEDPEAGLPLFAALEDRRHDGRPTVVVSEEVGLGVHPPTQVGSLFRDALGQLNRAIAEMADEVILVVAGRVLPLEKP